MQAEQEFPDIDRLLEKIFGEVKLSPSHLKGLRRLVDLALKDEALHNAKKE